MTSERLPCGCPPNDRHNWNCPLTPIYMEAFWDAPAELSISRRPD